MLGLLVETPGGEDDGNVTLRVRLVGGKLGGVGDDHLVDTNQLPRNYSLEKIWLTGYLLTCKSNQIPELGSFPSLFQ